MPDSSPPGELFTFPGGLPGFEQDLDFRLSRREGLDPLLFLDSGREQGPGFVCVPVEMIVPDYAFRLDEAAAGGVGLPAGEHRAGEAPCMVLALLTFPPSGAPTANLLAPVVLNPEARLGGQVIQYDSGYGTAYPVHPVRPVKNVAGGA